MCSPFEISAASTGTNVSTAGRVVVIGAGVIGLTTSLVLARSGYDVSIWYDIDTASTTSGVAAAMWHPYLVGETPACTSIAIASWNQFASLAAAQVPGVHQRAVHMFDEHPIPIPPWGSSLAYVESFQPPPPFLYGQRFSSFLMETPLYLPWLQKCVLDAGVKMTKRHIESFSEALDAYPIVVNCAGLGSQALVPDQTVRPIRGQIVSVANPGLEDITIFQHEELGSGYVIPRSDDCIVGGTADEGAIDCTPDHALARAIVDRCASVVEPLRDAPILNVLVGLRPWRPTLHIDSTFDAEQNLVIHNYGHGGAGVTLSWGSAAVVLDLLQAATAH